MFELIIKYQNGSIYWRERFNSMNAMNEWLDTEKTRPYWKEEFTTESVDHTPSPPSQAEIDQLEATQDQIRTLRARVKILAQQNDLTAAELKEAVMKFLKAIYLNKGLD